MLESLSKKLRGDWQIWFIVFLLSLFSIALVFSSVSALAVKHKQGNVMHFFIKHGLFIIAGLILMYVVHRVKYTLFPRLSLFFMILSIILMVYAWRFGVTVGNASRWIRLPGGMTFQPSDLAKIALITNLAAMLARRQYIKYSNTTILYMIAWCGIICGLITLSNFSTAALLAVTCFILMWLGRVPAACLFRMFVIVFIIAIPMGLLLGQRSAAFKKRIETFFSPRKESNKNDNYQGDQALIAISTGGFWGKGPGNSDQKNYLPEAFSDFIYAISIEEYGLFGGIILLFLYLWLLFRGMKIIENTTRAFGGLLSVGLTFSIVFQAIIHMIINVGLVPVTGQTLPLVSMGGSAFVFTCVALGMVLSVSKGDNLDEKEELKE